MAETYPTDDEIVESLRGHAWLATYVVKNVARRKHPKVQTPWILRRLKALETVGRVRRVQTNYARDLCWAIKGAQDNG